MSEEYEIPVGDTGHESGTFLMTLTNLKPFTLYETTKGWMREAPTDGGLVEAYNKIEWVFIDEDEQVGIGTTSTARSERSTLYAWATGLGLAPVIVLDRSKPIPASELIGRTAMVTFAPDKNGYSRISSVVPAPKARGGTSPASQAAAAADPVQAAVERGMAAPVAADSPPRRLDAAGTPLEPVRTGAAVDVDDIPF